ncbi:MAG: hypothetical protein K2L17_03505 [Muribaculaceae bacterium]|nr:hypothetical protein [Muribaculaceae bacterium]
MKEKSKIWLSTLAITALMSVGYQGLKSLTSNLSDYDTLTIMNVEALTEGDYDYNQIPQIRWEPRHGQCYRTGFENGEVTTVPTPQKFGFSIPNRSGSATVHEHDCTFYCPVN